MRKTKFYILRPSPGKPTHQSYGVTTAPLPADSSALGQDSIASQAEKVCTISHIIRSMKFRMGCKVREKRAPIIETTLRQPGGNPAGAFLRPSPDHGQDGLPTIE